jgi:hypothetical protein
MARADPRRLFVPSKTIPLRLRVGRVDPLAVVVNYSPRQPQEAVNQLRGGPVPLSHLREADPTYV